MACYCPLEATQLPGGAIIVHRRTPGMPRNPTPAGYGRDLKLPCGRCIGCKIDRSTTWATRCLHESQQCKASCFLTLTIDEESTALAAPGGSLSKRTHQTFMKRLRAHTSQKIRYYMCGEYGEKLGRPHYHYLIFGYEFRDKKYLKTSKSGEKLYTSETLDALWQHGHAWIGDVTYESCAYVAAYVMKKLNGPIAVEHYLRTDEAGNNYWLQPEFNEMSRRPGIARSWWEQYNQDVHLDDHVVKKNGGKMRPPRYYDKLLEAMNPAQMALIKFKRELRARELAEDNTPARLQDKETVTRAKLSLKKEAIRNDMKMIIIGIYDRKAETFIEIGCSPAVGVAARQFTDAINKQSESPLYKWPNDHDLYELGEADTETGHVLARSDGSVFKTKLIISGEAAKNLTN